ncbi:MAG: hypothetical protein IKJ11_09580 [Clostridia bacterium]|nr:hypothetical protein [Clostridia bacterium]
MATTERIRISTEVLEDIQEKLEQLNSELQSNCSAVRLWADRIERQSGADLQISTGLKVIGSGDARALLRKCDKALRLCEQESQRLTKAIGSGSTLFVDNENMLVSRFNNESMGDASGYQGTGGGGGTGGTGEENPVSEEEKNSFVAGMMDFVQNLLSLGDDGQKIFDGLIAAIRAFGGTALSAELIALSNAGLSGIAKNAALESLFGKMSGLSVAAFVLKVATGVASDIQNGVAPDRIACNAIGNTITAALTTVGGAVVGDLLTAGIVAAVGAICPPAAGPLTYVIRPLCNMVATMGIDALMGVEIFGKSVNEHINDAVYAAYNGIKDGIEYAKEAFNTLGDMAQTGAEMIQQGVESAIDFTSDVIDAGKEAISDAVDAGKEFMNNAIDNGKEFVNNAIDKGREAVSDFGEAIQDGITGFIDGGLSLLGA